jgi:dihydroorotate dehydrogenase
MVSLAFMSLAVALLRLLPPEQAHRCTLALLKHGGAFLHARPVDPMLATRVWDLDFAHPVGLAAGFDKNAECVTALLNLGFAFVETGTVTPRPQPGNPKPRLFRLPAQRAVINRLGFNSEGLDVYTKNLRALGPSRARGIVGANIGRNKESTDAVADYVTGIRSVSDVADYVTVNISSPNTPGLRGLQNREELEQLLSAVQAARHTLPKKPPLLVKIAPDLDEAACEGIAEVALHNNVDGLIVSNTTLSRPDYLPPGLAAEAGGLSGPPLFELSTQILARMYRLTQGRLPLVGVGGISSAEDAYAKIRAGASLVQLYTAFIYQGPELLNVICEGLVQLLRRDGFKNIREAVGTTV